jgi:hypothetical protein
MNNQDFGQAYNEIELRMEDLAKRNGDIYVPNIVPHGPVDYIFICMEPSLGEWARTPDEAENRLKGGFRNFLDGYNLMILRYAIQNYLCKNNQRYHITDLSKGAMLVKDAGVDRIARYKNWYPLLLEEIDLVTSPNARVFAVGTHVARFLESQKFPREVTLLIHYSGNTVSHWNRVLQEHEEDFKLFQGTVTHEDFLDNAKDVIESSRVPYAISERALGRLRKGNLTLSRLKLMFNYKLIFDRVSEDAFLGR